MTIERVSTHDAIRLVAEHGFIITDPESDDCGRTIIHTRAGGFGADWDLADAVKFVRTAHSQWHTGLFGTTLISIGTGADDRDRTIQFDTVTKPEGWEPS